MERARTRYSGDLGQSRQSLRPTAWHTHRNAPHGGVDFYPLFAQVGQAKGPQLILARSEHGECYGATFTIGVQLR
jgi:hypothetical protein